MVFFLTSNTLCDPVNIEIFDALTHANLHSLKDFQSKKIPCSRLLTVKFYILLLLLFCALFKTQDLKNHTLFRGTYPYMLNMGVPPPPPRPRAFVIVNIVEVFSNSMHLYFSVISFILQLSNSLLKTLKIYSKKKRYISAYASNDLHQTEL